MVLELIALGILFLIVLVIVVFVVGIMGIVFAFFPAVVAGLIVWFITGSLIWGGAAFLAVALLMMLLKRR